jgi:predicted acetyltransferase
MAGSRHNAGVSTEAVPAEASTGFDVRPYEGDARAFLNAVEVPFAFTPRDEDFQLFEPLIELDRALAAYDGGRVVGTAGIFSMGLTVPGGELPMAGVTMVSVHPTHRRRGLLREMMRQQLEAIHRRHEPLAGLWASEGAIYQRFGYGMATLAARFEIERARSAFRETPAPTGSLRLVDADAAARLFPPVFEKVRAMRAGVYDRPEAWWRSEFFHDPEHQRNGGSPATYVVHETDGMADAYARYRLHPEWDERGPKYALEVLEAMATTPEATAELWRYLLDVDLVATIRGRNLPIDHPLLLLLAEPRRLGWGVGDALWLRVVDLVAALEGRGWAADGRIVLEVRDETCPWNAGRWELSAEGGGGRVTATTRSADLALHVRDLGAAYLGGVGMSQLHSAGRIAELTPGAADRADAMLRTAFAPWCPTIF